jgi:cytochrome bd ubiquinol oxidase subunit I
MDVLTLSRIQFAVTAGFHFIFVPLTLGLSVLVAYMESLYVKTNDEMYLRMTKFWGKLFLINFALGIVTGITLEFQFGMNWAEYSIFVGDIFGSPLAIEATVAFFLESTFIGVWIFGWRKVSKRFHAVSIWIVAVATNLSALWILIANGWMQNPVGYVLRNGRAEMVDFMAMLSNPYGWLKFFHTVFSGYVIAAFFVMGVAAYHLLRKRNVALFKSSFRIAATFGLAATILVAVAGSFSAELVAKIQPSKLAAMEAVWETERSVPFNLVVIPDTENETNSVEALGVPGLLSLLAYHDTDAEIRGLRDFPEDERPPVGPTFWSYRSMIVLGGVFILLCVIAVYLSRKDLLESYRPFLLIMLFAIPLPYIAGQAGWLVAEIGRQPWIVYGLMKTSDAVSSSISVSQVVSSLVGFTLLYGSLAVLDIYLLVRFSRKGPEEDTSKLLSLSQR